MDRREVEKFRNTLQEEIEVKSYSDHQENLLKLQMK